MIKSHVLGLPRIGKKRELKFALEDYWKGEASFIDLEACGRSVRHENLQKQENLDYTCVGDFSFYDQVLDTSVLFGNLPERICNLQGTPEEQYFRAARGRASIDRSLTVTEASEMTKWFDTNYHYMVPEFTQQTAFSLQPQKLLSEINEARSDARQPKPVILGPLTYLWLGKSKDGSNKLDLLEKLLPHYRSLLNQLYKQGVDWVQMDEPALVFDLPADWQMAYRFAYQYLSSCHVNKLLTSYFGAYENHKSLVLNLPVEGVHVDCIRAPDDASWFAERLSAERTLSLGLIDGRNVWKADLSAQLDFAEKIQQQFVGDLWISTSCSLLHCPIDIEQEHEISEEVRDWLAFAVQKLDEVSLIHKGLKYGRDAIAEELSQNQASLTRRKKSKSVHNSNVKQRCEAVISADFERAEVCAIRAKLQQKELDLPLYPTTSIGSFPQTQSIRQARQQYRKHDIDQEQYLQTIKADIKYCIETQEAIDIDVLVHGEAERNDMVEYFGEQLEGFVFSRFGWVQSYGSRCVKPPIIYGDIQRPSAMTVEWARYAQSLTTKPVKGMLTGPVTILNWSFVRDDQPRSETCKQIALAIRDEVADLESAGIRIIQIDEPAIREGLPLRQSNWKNYLTWAVNAFKLSAACAAPSTQIHTHMCYSEFNDIIDSIAAMDADVITIETSRSDMKLLQAFENFNYPNQIGPGVYDIHSPNVPEVTKMVDLIKQAGHKLAPEQLWVNPDCGLKTRNWDEVKPALQNMVAAAKNLRAG